MSISAPGFFIIYIIYRKMRCPETGFADLPFLHGGLHGTGQGLGRSTWGINGKPISKGLKKDYKFLSI
jgi:hypothetical protein